MGHERPASIGQISRMISRRQRWKSSRLRFRPDCCAFFSIRLRRKNKSDDHSSATLSDIFRSKKDDMNDATQQQCLLFPVEQIISTSVGAMCTAMLMVERPCANVVDLFLRLVLDAVRRGANPNAIGSTSVESRAMLRLSDRSRRSRLHMF